jgi:hypothetical protein
LGSIMAMDLTKIQEHLKVLVDSSTSRLASKLDNKQFGISL